MSFLNRWFDFLVYTSLWIMAISALGMASSYGAVVFSKVTGFSSAPFVVRTSRWSVRLAWAGAIGFAVGFLLFLIITVADYLIKGDPVG